MCPRAPPVPPDGPAVEGGRRSRRKLNYLVMASTVLVTGGAGFIGSHLVRALLSRGHTVRVLDNLSTGFRENLAAVESDIEFLHEDIRDVDACDRAMKGVDTLFHLAALASVSRSMRDPIATHEVNVNGTVRLLEAARKHGVRRCVFSSSSSVYGETPALPKAEDAEPLPKSPYAASKLSAEQYTLAYARAGLVEGVALRYFNVFGPRQDANGPYAAVIPLVMRAALTRGRMTVFGDGLQTRDFTYVDNVVHANLLAASAPAEQASGQVTNVGGGRRISLMDLINEVGRLSGHPIDIDYQPPRPGDIKHSLASLDRARQATGYEPLVSMQEGLSKTWEWASAQAADPVGHPA